MLERMLHNMIFLSNHCCSVKKNMRIGLDKKFEI